MSPIGRAGFGAVVATALWAAAPAAAAPAPAQEGESTPVMVVLDASGSMKQADAPGPRIDAAKQAVTGLVAALPSSARVGLTVYGTGTGSTDAEKAAGCQDIRQLLPVQPVDRAAFGRAVAGIRASGYTPIGRSLQKAAQALPAEGPRSVVLVSDGEDTCAPPQPCEVAEELKAAGTDLVVHTIGFKVGAAARTQLSCIAAATGGTYREAASGAALGAVLTNRVQRAIRPYTAVGRPIRGGATPAAAPTIGPGQYLDTYAQGGTGPGRPGTTKFYAVQLRPGETPYFSATVAPLGIRVERLGTLQVVASLVDADGDLCVGGIANAFDIGVFGKVSPQTAVLAPPPVGGDRWRESCAPGRPVHLKVARSGDAYRTQQLPMEIAYRSEPGVSSPGPAAVTERSPALPAPAEGSARPVEAGSSFNDAPRLEPGTYADEIVPGETRYFKVRLGWGQRLAYRVTVPAAGLRIQAAALYTSVASPLRAKLDQPPDTRAYELIGGGKDQTIVGSTEAPVRYANRGSTVGTVGLVSVDGDYYLVLDATYPIGEKAGFTMPYRLTVAAEGAVEGGPTYLTDPGSSVSPSASPSGSASPSVSGSGSGAVSGWSGPGPAVWAGGAGVLVAVGAVAVALLRRRRGVS